MTSFIVEQRIDGRGGIRPFGTYTGTAQGAKVNIGNKWLTVTKDGRVNIPKSVFEKSGVMGADGRRRIEITFATKKDIEGGSGEQVFGMVSRPKDKYGLSKTGDVIPKKDLSDVDALEPSDGADANWSP